MANQIFEDYTESINQDWRNTPIQHRSGVWGETFETLQRLFLQFHELQHPAWTDYHSHTAGRHPHALQDKMIHWQVTFPALITTTVQHKVPDWTTDDYPATASIDDNEGSSDSE